MQLFRIAPPVHHAVLGAGKSGTTSLLEALKPLGGVVHTHSLWYHMRCTNPAAAAATRSAHPGALPFTYFNILDENRRRHATTARTFVYDAYREPIERKLSAWFQLITADIVHNKLQSRIAEWQRDPFLRAVVSFDLRALTADNFVDHMCKHIDHFVELFTWTGFIHLDNYYPHQTYRNLRTFSNMRKGRVCHVQEVGDDYTYVILRFSAIQQWSRVLSRLHGRRIDIAHENRGASKGAEGDPVARISALQTAFKQRFRPPRSLMRAVFLLDHRVEDVTYNHAATMRVFHTRQETEDYLAWWLKRCAPDPSALSALCRAYPKSTVAGLIARLARLDAPSPRGRSATTRSAP